MVGMGGAGLANIPGSAGTLINVSAPAVRLTTDNDKWTFDWHFDYLNSQLSSDFDNNGVSFDKASGAQLVTLGAALRYGDWAGAITTTAQTAPIDDASQLEAQNLRLRIAVARWIPRIDTAIGIGVQTIAFRILHTNEELFRIESGGAMAGATWIPAMQDFRIAAEFETPIFGGDVKNASCDPMACTVDGSQPYILPNEVESSARLGIGGAYRFGPSSWNQLVKPKFRDEQSLTIAADIWVTGPSKNGFGIEKFSMQELQRSGEHTNVGARLGAELEAIPGRLRLRAGTYYEPRRFDAAGGRFHGTAGVEGRVFEFNLWGVRRGRIGITTDFARRYRNIALSIGFWH
jgi:hypothetical protein